MDHAHARVARRLRHDPRGVDVCGDEVTLARRGDQAGEMHHRRRTGKLPGEDTPLERPPDRHDLVAARDESADDMLSDETGRAGDGDLHLSAFS
jgi:hypothetical protein